MNTQTDQSREPFVQLSEPWPEGWMVEMAQRRVKSNPLYNSVTFEVVDSDASIFTGEGATVSDAARSAIGELLQNEFGDGLSIDALIAALTADIEHVLTDGGS